MNADEIVEKFIKSLAPDVHAVVAVIKGGHSSYMKKGPDPVAIGLAESARALFRYRLLKTTTETPNGSLPLDLALDPNGNWEVVVAAQKRKKKKGKTA